MTNRPLPTRALIIDDNPIYCNAICTLLKETELQIPCDSSHDGKSGLNAIKHGNYSLVLLDIQMPEINGIELAKFLKQNHPNIKVVMLTFSNCERKISQLMKLGVDGYILKSSGRSELIYGINQVVNGKSFLTSEAMSIYHDYLLKESRKKTEQEEKVPLTKREIEVLGLICRQMTTRAIAEKLFISETTVNNHRANIMKKIKTDNLVGTVLYAIRKGYFSLDSKNQ